MDVYTVTFFGHRRIDNILEVEETLFTLIQKLINEKDYVEFLVGRNGDFDRCVSSVITQIKKFYRDDNSHHVLVLPYATAEHLKNQASFEEYYDEVIVYDSSQSFHPKAVFYLRNTEMADSADEVVCYIERKSGGAYNAVKYAKSKGKKITNIA